MSTGNSKRVKECSVEELEKELKPRKRPKGNATAVAESIVDLSKDDDDDDLDIKPAASSNADIKPANDRGAAADIKQISSSAPLVNDIKPAAENGDDDTTRALPAADSVNPDANKNKMDDEVAIEREDSAWDVLRNTFETAASNGRYLDLTAEDNGQLTIRDAAEAFENATMPQNPSTIVHTTESLAAARACENNPILIQLSKIVLETVSQLSSARKSLGLGHAPLKLVKKINRKMKQIQKLVHQNGQVILDNPGAVGKIEKLNLLVLKANVLINDVNRNGKHRRTWFAVRGADPSATTTTRPGTRSSKRLASQLDKAQN